jgi:hypothetical protein
MHLTPVPHEIAQASVANCCSACRNFKGRGLVGELAKDNYIYENLPQLRSFNFADNSLGYSVAPIPNDIHKLVSLQYLYALLTTMSCPRCRQQCYTRQSHERLPVGMAQAQLLMQGLVQ